MLKAIFWDNDGVLVDTEGIYFEVTRTVLADAGFPLRTEEFIELSLRQGRSAFEVVRGALDDAAIERLRGRATRCTANGWQPECARSTASRRCLPGCTGAWRWAW
jgi:beta-phosphoglucomutase-like phosphatase (HAD superfamily)